MVEVQKLIKGKNTFSRGKQSVALSNSTVVGMIINMDGISGGISQCMASLEMCFCSHPLS